jgi:flagellar biosynthesis/type III secretory pathway protein FliH
MHPQLVSTSLTDKFKQKITDKRTRLQKRLLAHKNSIFKKGLLRGKINAENSHQELTAKIETELLKHENFKFSMIKEASKSMVQKELSKPDTIVHMCEKLFEDKPMEVSMHPSDAANVKNFKKSRLWQKVTIHENEQLALGSLVIKTKNRIIEAHVSDQIDFAMDLLALENKKWQP